MAVRHPTALRTRSITHCGKYLTPLEMRVTITDVVKRKYTEPMKAVIREVLLSFWKVHILHHAGEKPAHGQWILTELRRHGYELSPGTLYPLLNRMAGLGWLKCTVDPGGGRRARKDYRLTSKGRKVLALIREQLEELYEEVVLETDPERPAAASRRAASGT
jgi:PadR family transcriptional regulator PadR